MSNLTLVSKVKCFGGWQYRYSHDSAATKCKMTFTVFVPPQASDQHKVPALLFLSGLTCNDENFIIKSGAQREASSHGIALISPDTSPRGCNIEGESESWDFGVGAGFYLNATQQKWKEHWNMYTYITEELLSLVTSHFPIRSDKISITGHSMGGLGALQIGLKNPDKFVSVSAFAPICHPSNCPWGKKAFTGYLGEDTTQWKQYDPTELVAAYKGKDLHIFIDQGTDDKFYNEKQLLPEDFEAAAKANNVPVTVRYQQGYDHSYFFISTYFPDHIAHHAKFLSS